MQKYYALVILLTMIVNFTVHACTYPRSLNLISTHFLSIPRIIKWVCFKINETFGSYNSWLSYSIVKPPSWKSLDVNCLKKQMKNIKIKNVHFVLDRNSVNESFLGATNIKCLCIIYWTSIVKHCIAKYIFDFKLLICMTTTENSTC